MNNNKIEQYKQNIINKQNIKKILQLIQLKLNKTLNKLELINLIKYINNLNYIKLYQNNKEIDKTNEYISNIYIDSINEVKLDYDIHEYMKRDMELDGNLHDYKFPNIVSGFNNKENKNLESLENLDTTIQTQNVNINNIPDLTIYNNLYNFTRILNYKSLWRDSNILLDSRYQNISNTDRTRIEFNIVSDTKNKIPGSGAITSISKMSNIVEIEIFEFSIPYVSMADNYYKKITLSILELSAISIDTYEDSQYHFMFSTEQNGNLINLKPINNIFRFSKPIANLNNLTLRFGSPLNPIQFDKDRLYTTSIDYTSNPGLITFSEPHHLITGDIVYINDFTTLDPAADVNIINEINDKQGHICNRISDTVISIDVNFTTIIAPDSNLSIEIYLGSKRILLPLKLKYLLNI